MKKTFKTLEEQIKILESRGLIINDYDKTYVVLMNDWNVEKIIFVMNVDCIM